MSDERSAWGRAYRGGSLVCGRVYVTIREDRLGPSSHGRRYITVRFLDRLHPALRAELVELAHHLGPAARRAAERMEPIVVVIDDPVHGRERMVGRIEPPKVRGLYGGHVEFELRETAR